METTVPMTARVPVELAKRVREAARDEDRSPGAWIRRALTASVARAEAAKASQVAGRDDAH